MKTTAAGLLLAALLFSSLPGLGQSYPYLIADSGLVLIPGKMYYQNVSITGGAYAALGPNPRHELIIGITCNSFLLGASASIVYGATSHYGTSTPLSWNRTGTPNNIRGDGEGGTLGNGAGTYGGRGYNISDDAKEPYGSTDSFEIKHGSIGTQGESYTKWVYNQYYTYEGYSGGRTAGAIMIVGNDVTIEGRINTDGESGWDGGNNPCPVHYPGYSGSGGGILIAAKNLTISDTARITANGGEYAIKEECNSTIIPYRYHSHLVGKRDGGGGRIKILYERGTISSDAVIEAEGWENGTIYIQQVPSIARLMNPGDVNEDGVTNYEDLFLLQQSWQQELTPIPGPEETPTPTPTPEP